MSEDLWNAAMLGVVEGLTEFIPVSSTGHLILLVDRLGFRGPPGKVFEVAIQLGAISAICWVYRTKLWNVAISVDLWYEQRCGAAPPPITDSDGGP